MIELLNINTSLSPSFEPFWFNSEEYAGKQAEGEGILLYYKKEEKEIFLRLYRKDQTLISPLRAPFGSLEFSTQTDLQTLYEFVKESLEKIKLSGIRSMQLVAPPECYDLQKADMLDEVLIHAGFSVTVTELNYHLETNLGAFENFIHDSEKRRLRKSIQAGFECTVAQEIDYKAVHQLIAECRKRKGYPLSMPAEAFEKMFRDFPERYTLFTVKDQSKIIAAAVGVKVRSDILYNFLPADDEDYLSYSPIVLLNKAMYDYCCQNGYHLYDLGIATSGGVRNEGLIRFKEHLGAALSHKYSYEIKLG
ncbi:MAG TPA: GNAT family N-acetyltransferase [Cytophagaceae bacterium]|nr:GNAT family N-acetyltransferase [Cytophagaceae bacterium]